MSSEIPYFGEHTQITIVCESCGWKHTDFIPSDGEKPSFWKINIDEEEKMSARVIRSSSCTIRIIPLDLEVSPGSNSSGYVTNVEGVLNRFIGALTIIVNGAEGEEYEEADKILNMLGLHIELLDPKGRSQIIHDDAVPRELTDSEKESLQIGFELPVNE